MFIQWHTRGTDRVGLGFWWRYQLWLGVLLVLAGVIIIVYPEILAFIVASVIILAGLSLIGSAWQMRGTLRRSRFIDVDADQP